MTNIELTEKALEVYKNRDMWTYVQGGLGELSITNRIKGLYDYYRGKGNGSTCDYPVWLETYGKHNGVAKQCTDCSNFIQYLLGSGKNAAVSYYNKMQVVPDMYTAPVGSVLLIPNKHAGIVVTQGVRNADGTWKVLPEAMDFYAYNKPPRKATYVGALYTKAVYLDGVTYVSPDAVPVSMTAEVNGAHKLGDTLSAVDFTIKVKMSDGSTLTNPSNWSAWPLQLTSNVTDIVVKYKNLSCVLKVDFVADIK